MAVGRARHLSEDTDRQAGEAKSEVPADHGVVKEGLRRRRDGERCCPGPGNSVERPARGIGGAEAEVAGYEEGDDVAVAGETRHYGEGVGAAHVAGGGDGSGEGLFERLVLVSRDGHV